MPLIPPNATNPVAVVVDLTEFTSSTAASAETSTQGFGSVELKHRFKLNPPKNKMQLTPYSEMKLNYLPSYSIQPILLQLPLIPVTKC